MWTKVLPSLPVLSSRGGGGSGGGGGSSPRNSGIRSRASSADLYSSSSFGPSGDLHQQPKLDEAAIERMLTDPSWEERQHIQTQVIDVIVNDNDNFRELQRALRRSRVHTNQGVAAMINDATFARTMGRQAIKSNNCNKDDGCKKYQQKENDPNNNYLKPAEEGKRASQSSSRRSEPTFAGRRQRKSSIMRGSSVAGSNLQQEGVARSGWRSMRVGLKPPVSITASLESFFLNPSVEEGCGYIGTQSANNSPRGGTGSGGTTRRRLAAGRRNTTSDIKSLFDEHRRPSHERSSYGSICKEGPADRSYSMINLRQLTPEVVEVLSTYEGAYNTNNGFGDGSSSTLQSIYKRSSLVQQSHPPRRAGGGRAMSSPPSKLRQLFGGTSASCTTGTTRRNSQPRARLSLTRAACLCEVANTDAGQIVVDAEDDDAEEPGMPSISTSGTY